MDHRRYNGGPESLGERVEHWLQPKGGALTDGMRLAVMNSIGLFAAMLLIAIVGLVTRVISWIFPIWLPLTTIPVLIVVIIVAAFGWRRYAQAHVTAAQATGSSLRPDLFGLVGGSPFLVLASLLLASGLFSLFLGALTFSGGRVFGGFRQLVFALVFVLLAGANILIARSAASR